MDASKNPIFKIEYVLIRVSLHYCYKRLNAQARKRMNEARLAPSIFWMGASEGIEPATFPPTAQHLTTRPARPHRLTESHQFPLCLEEKLLRSDCNCLSCILASKETCEGPLWTEKRIEIQQKSNHF